jgi:outer membrane protein OmpA-like peptidoglycan-associated protein
MASADPFEVSLKNQVRPGEKPTLSVRALEPLTSVKLNLRGDEGRELADSKGPLKKGQLAVFTIGDGNPGRVHWKGYLTVTLPDGRWQEAQVTFETAILGQMQVFYQRESLDLAVHRFEFKLNRPAGRATLRVFGANDQVLGEGGAMYHGESAGQPLRIGWSQEPGEVLRVEVRAEDKSGAATLLRLFPWSVPVPHEEVVFATGSAAIAPPEEQKLVESYRRLLDAVERVRKMEPQMPLRVYVAGHTDTVGTAEDNRRLSRDRARAIAAFFKSCGLQLPLAYAGFGEEALKVKTPDGTDEAQNRRADYILGAEEPVLRGIKAHWSELK